MTGKFTEIDKSLKELRAKIEKAEAAFEESKSLLLRAEREYAATLASALGVSIGSVVYTTDHFGHGPERKERKTRYCIDRIEYRSYRQPPLELHGKVIRKDSSLGERREVWKEWKLESSGPADGPSASIPENPPV